jgi:hypothetical protein
MTQFPETATTVYRALLVLNADPSHSCASIE